MVDYPVAVDRTAVATLSECLEDGRSEIGAQLHAWVTPPHHEVVDAFTSHAGNLPLSLEAAKLDTLTQAITTSFGKAPAVFGRAATAWGRPRSRFWRSGDTGSTVRCGRCMIMAIPAAWISARSTPRRFAVTA
ncbi:hypothetical protein P0F65_05650 [Sphingomonas sp. I4]